jgi:hypothetical protein
MANSLSAASPLLWSKIMGRKRFKTNVFRALASFAEQPSLTFGLSVDRPYRSNLVVENYTKGTAANVQDISATSDKLEINKQKTILIYIDTVDKLQNKYDLMQVNAEEMGKRQGEAMDAEFLYEVINANNTIDAADFGGSSGTGLTLSTSNVSSVLAKINRKLNSQNCPVEGRFAAISPQFHEILWNYISGKESLLGDKSGEYGHVGKYAGLDLYLTNNLTASAVWTPANQPSDGDTITIGGVTFTFETGTLDAAGKVKSETSTAVTLDNLVAFINAGGAGVASQGYDLSVANQRIVQNMVAVDGTTYVTVYQKGVSFMTVSGSDATDTWTKPTQHVLAGMKNAIDMVIQKEPTVQMDEMLSNGKFGVNVGSLDVFGCKTFNQGKNEIVNVKIDTSDTTLFA